MPGGLTQQIVVWQAALDQFVGHRVADRAADLLRQGDRRRHRLTRWRRRSPGCPRPTTNRTERGVKLGGEEK